MKDDIYGFGFDWWVWCVGQEIHSIDKQIFDKISYTTHEYDGICSSMPVPFCDCKGIHYDFTSDYKELGGTIFVNELTPKGNHYFSVPWLTEKEIKDVRRLEIDFEYRETLIKSLKYLVNKSPVRKLYLNIRCQCLDNDNIIGMLTVDQLEKLMNENQLLGNVVYVIYEPTND